MKKIILFLFTLVICFSVFCGLNVKATGISLTMSNVVGIRTSGTQQGLRFSCSASEDFDGSTEHGFYLAIGNFDKDTFTAAIESNATTIGEKPLVNKNTNGTDKDFAITVIFPEDASVNDLCTYITSIAYYKNGEDFVFSDINLTKNVADEARKLYNASESIDSIVSTVAETTKVKVTHSDNSVNYYSTLALAIAATFAEGDTVNLVRGTYNNNLTIGVDNFTLTGPYKDNDNFAERTLEANYTGTITVDAEVHNCELNGLKFSNQSNIKSNCNDATSDVCYNLDGFSFKYNKVSSALSEGKGFVYFFTNSTGGYRYDKNISFEYNDFETLEGYNATKFIYLCDNENVTFLHNSFTNMRKDCFYVQDYGKGLAGSFNVQYNTFTNMFNTAMAINIHWLAHLTTNTYSFSILNNHFNSGNNTVYINIETSNSSLQYSEFKINNNVFKGNTKVLWFDASIMTGAEFKNNDIYVSASQNGICKSDGYYGSDTTKYTNQYHTIDCSNNYFDSEGNPYTLTASNKTSWFTLKSNNGTYDIVKGTDVE